MMKIMKNLNRNKKRMMMKKNKKNNKNKKNKKIINVLAEAPAEAVARKMIKIIK